MTGANIQIFTFISCLRISYKYIHICVLCIYEEIYHRIQSVGMLWGWVHMKFTSHMSIHQNMRWPFTRTRKIKQICWINKIGFGVHICWAVWNVHTILLFVHRSRRSSLPSYIFRKFPVITSFGKCNSFLCGPNVGMKEMGGGDLWYPSGAHAEKQFHISRNRTKTVLTY